MKRSCENCRRLFKERIEMLEEAQKEIYRETGKQYSEQTKGVLRAFNYIKNQVIDEVFNDCWEEKK